MNYSFRKYILMGDIIGNGECLYFSKTDRTIYSDFEGEIIEYKDFDNFLVYLAITLEAFAESELGENCTDLYNQI